MAEFKITKALSSEISTLQSDGNAINDGFKATPSDDVSSLSAAMEFIKEQKQIKQMLELYSQLLVKDANDLTEMVKTVEAADQAASKTYSV